MAPPFYFQCILGVFVAKNDPAMLDMELNINDLVCKKKNHIPVVQSYIDNTETAETEDVQNIAKIVGYNNLTDEPGLLDAAAKWVKCQQNDHSIVFANSLTNGDSIRVQAYRNDSAATADVIALCETGNSLFIPNDIAQNNCENKFRSNMSESCDGGGDEFLIKFRICVEPLNTFPPKHCSEVELEGGWVIPEPGQGLLTNLSNGDVVIVRKDEETEKIVLVTFNGEYPEITTPDLRIVNQTNVDISDVFNSCT